MGDIQTPVHTFTVDYCSGVVQTASSPDRLATSAVRMAEQPDLCARATDKGGIILIKRSLKGPAALGLGGLSVGRIVNTSFHTRLLPVAFGQAVVM